jgi:hypothetical protein
MVRLGSGSSNQVGNPDRRTSQEVWDQLGAKIDRALDSLKTRTDSCVWNRNQPERSDSIGSESGSQNIESQYVFIRRRRPFTGFVIVPRPEDLYVMVRDPVKKVAKMACQTFKEVGRTLRSQPDEPVFIEREDAQKSIFRGLKPCTVVSVALVSAGATIYSIYQSQIGSQFDVL